MGYCIAPEGEERFDGDWSTREQAIAEAPGYLELHPGDKFQVGCSRPLGLPSIDGGTIIEQALDDLESDCGEAAEDAIDATREQERDLGEMLTATFQQWADKHGIKVTCWAVDHVETHVVPAAPVGAGKEQP
jgi:hypothetical protein